MLRPFFGRAAAPLLAVIVVALVAVVQPAGASVMDSPQESGRANVEVLQPPDTWQFWRKPGAVGAPLLGDVNGDGKQDLIMPANTGDVYVGVSLGFQFATPELWLSGFCGPVCQAGDVDGDGRADLVNYVWGDGSTPGSADVSVALSTGQAFTNRGVWNNGFCIREQVCQLTDVDNDRRVDLVAFTPYTGLVWVSKSTGGSFGTNTVLHNYFCIVTERCHVGDVDGDGRGDLIAFKPTSPGNQKGNVLWARSTGSGFEAARLGHGFFCIDSEICSVGDFDGDGRADIMLLKQVPYEGTWELLVALSDGGKFVNASPFSWSTSIPGHLGAAGDVDGDRRADLLTYVRANGSNDVSFYVAASKPKPPTNPPPTTPPPNGISRLEVFNCTVEQRDLYLWVFDSATGALVVNSGAVEHMYDSTGTCPAVGEPWDFNPDNGRWYDVIAVDPALIGCGVNDPSIPACQKQALRLLGNDSGPLWQVVVPSG
ncbi:FG-GAP repeat domain-containing protein [Actinophytocola sediminis]